MIIGFTGTREGMTEYQKARLFELLRECKCTEFHHGDCIGADDQAATIAAELGIDVVCHPPRESKIRAFNSSFKQICEESGYRARNREIVDDTDMLIAAPKQTSLQRQGGSWYTIRYAQKKGKTVQIIWPVRPTA